MNDKKPTLGAKNAKAEQQPDNNGTTRPKNPPANAMPTEGYVIEIDGKFKSEYATSEQATKAGSELKKKYPQIQVKIYDAKVQTRTAVDLSA